MMAGFELSAQEPYVLQDPQSLGQISSVIAFYGAGLEASVIAHFNQSLALLLTENIFGIQTKEMNEDVLDAVGEVANMICGRMKTELTNEKGHEYTMTVPTMVVGEKYKTYIKIKDDAMIFPYVSPEKDQRIHLEVKVREFE